MVAGRDLDGRHHLRRGYTPGRLWLRGAQRRRRQLDLVERRYRRHAHGVLLCAPVATRWHFHRRRVHRAPLYGTAGGYPPGLPGSVLRCASQLRDHRLGQPGYGQDPAGDNGMGPLDSGPDQPRNHRRLCGRLGPMGYRRDRSLSVCAGLVRCYRACLVRPARP